MTMTDQPPKLTQRQCYITGYENQRDLLALFRELNVDYKRVAQIAHLDKRDLAKLGEVRRASIQFDDKIPARVAEHLTAIANLANLVAEYFNGDVQKVELWFKLPNPMLGNISPRDMIRLGRYERLSNFVLDARQAETEKNSISS